MGITHTISERTISSVTDKRCIVLSGKPLARTLAVGSSWTSILIGIRMALDSEYGLSAPDSLISLGMINGISNLPTVSDGSVTNFVGVRTNPASSYTIQTGGWGYHQMYPYKIVAGTGTAGTPQYTDIRKASAGHGALFLKITKGSPNYTISLWFSETPSEMTRANFQALVDSGTPSGTGIINSINAADFAADETSGALDSVCLSFSNTTVNMEVADIYPKVLA